MRRGVHILIGLLLGMIIISSAKVCATPVTSEIHAVSAAFKEIPYPGYPIFIPNPEEIPPVQSEEEDEDDDSAHQLHHHYNFHPPYSSAVVHHHFKIEQTWPRTDSPPPWS